MNKREKLLKELLDVNFDLTIALILYKDDNQMIKKLETRRKEILEELEYLE